MIVGQSRDGAGYLDLPNAASLVEVRQNTQKGDVPHDLRPVRPPTALCNTTSQESTASTCQWYDELCLTIESPVYEDRRHILMSKVKRFLILVRLLHTRTIT